MAFVCSYPGLDTEMLARCVDIALASDVADSPKTDPRRGQQQHPPPQRRRAGGQQLFSLGINHMQGHYRSLLRVRACMALMAPGTQRGVCDGTDGLSGGWDPMHSGFGPAPEAMAHGMWQDSETWGHRRENFVAVYTPSTTLDNHLSHADFAIAVRPTWQGMQVAAGSVAPDAGSKHA
eukprot:s396_g7.t1